MDGGRHKSFQKSDLVTQNCTRDAGVFKQGRHSSNLIYFTMPVKVKYKPANNDVIRNIDSYWEKTCECRIFSSLVSNGISF